LQTIADLERRFSASSYGELLARAAEAERELDESSADGDPVEAAARALAAAEARVASLADELRDARRSSAELWRLRCPRN
jgi:DNA repair ATPase RecN